MKEIAIPQNSINNNNTHTNSCFERQGDKIKNQIPTPNAKMQEP